MKNKLDIRPSPIAGKWYTANASVLAQQVDDYINAARFEPIPDHVLAVMAPHAGHVYSGPVAGYAFAALRGLHPSTVVVVSPMHYPYPQAVLSTAHQAYATPLGTIPVDQAALARFDVRLKEELGIGLTLIKNDPEHSLEIELPFLQRVFPDGFNLLPIMLRDQSAPVARAVGTALADILPASDTVLVASTDLSHFYSQKMANQLDHTLLAQVEALDPAGVLQVEQEGRGFACGHGALAAVLWATQRMGANNVKILHYATSGDISGDYEQVVGYGAAAITCTQTA